MVETLLADHPYRAAIMEEVHARPVEIIAETCRLRRLVFVMPPQAGAMMSVFKRFAEFCAATGVSVPGPSSRQHSFATGQRHVTWEFHTEFVTVTWRSDLGDKQNWPDDLGLAALGDGLLIGAMRIDVIGDISVPDRLVPGFNLASLCLPISRAARPRWRPISCRTPTSSRASSWRRAV